MPSSAAHFDMHDGGVAFGLCPSGTTLLAVVPPARILFPSTVNLITLRNLSRISAVQGFMNQLFAALAQPQTSLSLEHSWHTQSQLGTFLAHRFGRAWLRVLLKSRL